MFGDGQSPPRIESRLPLSSGPPTTRTFRPAYWRTLFPVRRYLPTPAVSLTVSDPDVPGSWLTQPTSSTGLRDADAGEDDGVWAVAAATITEQDATASVKALRISPPRSGRPEAYCTATMSR